MLCASSINNAMEKVDVAGIDERAGFALVELNDRGFGDAHDFSASDVSWFH